MPKRKRTKFSEIRTTVLALNDDPALPWSAFPCIEFNGARGRLGYGHLTHPETKKNARPHRVAWEIVHGGIPDGIDILHHCDNRACFRPSHLFVGTAKDNMADCISKGRFFYRPPIIGEANNFSILTASEVIEMRRMYAQGVRIIDIQRAFPHVSRQGVAHVVHRDTWKHV